MIVALNAAKPAVFALMDYWTFDGWFALRKRLKEEDSPALTKTVFPGIELRLAAPTTCRLNAHVLFSDEISDQDLNDFKSKLIVAIIDKPLSDDALIQLARKVAPDKLKHHGFDKAAVDEKDKVAAMAGATIAELSCESYRKAIDAVPDGKAIGFMPFDTSDGLAEVKWHDHYAYFLGLFKSSPIFESRNPQLRDAFLNQETPENKNWLDNFQRGLNYIPRLVVSGSDAHRFTGVEGDNHKRGYGNFPSGKVTWIKADPTFLGLKQAILEPQKRSYIGERPEKVIEISKHKTYFIDSVVISKLPGANIPGVWLDDTNIELNSDLVAIIGNKGSGKSALADVIAMLGNSRQGAHFTFLRRERFRGKSGVPAKHFEGKLTWLDGSTEARNLNDDPPPEKAELVRYIPQGHFEALCNSHVSGKSDAFEQELRAVIFSHASEQLRLGALNFDQLTEFRERRFRDQLSELRKELGMINVQVESIERQLQPAIRKELEDLLALKQKQIDETRKIEPEKVSEPSDKLTPEQHAAAKDIASLNVKIQEVDTQAKATLASKSAESRKLQAVQNIRDRLRHLQRTFDQIISDSGEDFQALDMSIEDVASLRINVAKLDQVQSSVPAALDALGKEEQKHVDDKASLEKQLKKLKEKLNEPQLKYEAYKKAYGEWAEQLAKLQGSASDPDTLEGIKAGIKRLADLPQKLEELRDQRQQKSAEIYEALDSLRKSREELFQPVQSLIQANSLIRDDYKLQFLATLGGSADAVAESLFALIKQQSGEFRGEDESLATVRRLADQHGFESKDDTLGFVKALTDLICEAASGGASDAVGIANLVRKGKDPRQVYDLLFGLSFLEPRYTLLFQDTQIEQLSPGQRGALLLIFYLLVDKGRNPIILDQPEENLDNETVVSLLVPVLAEAKKRRQIIMVTHNPNLAVVCDAEQVIYSQFDRKGGTRITYTPGAIESPEINKQVINVLEGTRPAFDNRSIKYQ